MRDKTKAERMHKVTRAFSALNEIETVNDLNRERLTLTEYHAISENIRAFGSCRPDAKTETIYSGIADFFSRYGFTVKHSGISYTISF